MYKVKRSFGKVPAQDTHQRLHCLQTKSSVSVNQTQSTNSKFLLLVYLTFFLFLFIYLSIFFYFVCLYVCFYVCFIFCLFFFYFFIFFFYFFYFYLFFFFFWSGGGGYIDVVVVFSHTKLWGLYTFFKVCNFVSANLRTRVLVGPIVSEQTYVNSKRLNKLILSR